MVGLGNLIKIILKVVFFGIIIAAFLGVKDISMASTNENLCRASILRTWKLNSFHLTNPIGPLKSKIATPHLSGCKTSYARIDKKGITKEGRLIYDFSNYRQAQCNKRENKTMRFLADEMASCWSIFGRGDFDFAKVYKYVYGSKNFICYVCTQVYISELPCGNISFNKFENFLKENTIRINNGKTETSYYDYIYGDYNNELKSMKLSLDKNNYNQNDPAYEMDIPQDYEWVTYSGQADMIKSGIPVVGVAYPNLNISEKKTYYILFQVIGAPISYKPIPTILLVNLNKAHINCEKMFS